MAFKVFISYSHQDQTLRQELDKHLSNLKRLQIITSWYDGDSNPGTEWEPQIREQLNTAEIILLLVSADFMASDFCSSTELSQAITRHNAHQACVIPILLRPTDWLVAPFAKLTFLPTHAKAVTQWPTLDEAFEDVVGGIRRVLENLMRKDLPLSIQTPTLSTELPRSYHSNTVEWGEAPDGCNFYGREHDLSALEQWIVAAQCRLIALVGVGGIGKTSLAIKVTKKVQPIFEYVYWQSLQNAPSLQSVLKNCLHFLIGQAQEKVPEDLDGQISLLIECLRKHRCLIVLDNFESLFQNGYYAGQFKNGYAGFGTILQRIGEDSHHSCFFLTSREKPKEIAFLEGHASTVRSYRLQGVENSVGKAILKEKDLQGKRQNWEALISRYAGNPLALRLVGQFIQEIFDGNIAAFLQEKKALFHDIEEILDQQMHRLVTLEQDIMYWLAIEREAVSLDNLQRNIGSQTPLTDLQEAQRSLLRRHLIETHGARITLHTVILEYMTSQLVTRISEEFIKETFSLLATHALMKAQSKNYIRESQLQLILMPLSQRLLTFLGKKKLEATCKHILSSLRKIPPPPFSYTAGNILNLLIHLECTISKYNFSHLLIRQAYLQNARLHNVNFASAHFVESVFTDVFGSILSVAFSADGELLAGGTNNATIQVWNTSEKMPLFSLSGHSDCIYSVAFASQSPILASGSDDRTVRLWDVSTRQCLKVLQGHTHRIHLVVFSSDGRMLASGSDDGTVRLWEVDTGTCLAILPHSHSVHALTFSPDRKYLLSGGNDRIIRLWNTHTFHCLSLTTQAEMGRIRSLACHPNGTIFASSCFNEDCTIRLWDIATLECLHRLQGHTDSVRSLAFNESGTILASSGGSDDQTIKLWDMKTLTCTHTLSGHSSGISSLAFHPKETILASGGDDQTIRFWEGDTGNSLATLQGFAPWAHAVAFSPDGQFLASGHEDRTIQLWEITTGSCLWTRQSHTNRIRSVAFSPDGTLLASGGDDWSIRLWNVSTSACLAILQGHDVRSLTFSPDGNMLASGGGDTMIRFWNYHTEQCFRLLQGHERAVWSVAINSNGTTLASGSDDHTVRLWKVSTGTCLKILRGHTDKVRSVTFHPSGTLLASGSDDQTIRFWEVETGHCLRIISCPTKHSGLLSFSPDGTLLSSGSDDSLLRLWEVDTGRCSATLQAHTQPVYATSFNSDGNLIASSSTDGTITLWNVKMGTALKTLRGDRPYEQMNITGVTGITEDQKRALKFLGAQEVQPQKNMAPHLHK